MATQTNRSLSRRFDDYQPSKSVLLIGCVATAIATIIIGFNWGGWVTGGTSRDMARQAGNTARSELASAVCIDRFNAAPDNATQLVALKALTDSRKKRDFIEAGGWATMPGQTTPDHSGADACVTALVA